MTAAYPEVGPEILVPPPGDGTGDGYVRPFTRDQVRGFADAWRAIYPLPEPPPLANVDFALQLATALSPREYQFHGAAYTVAPLAYVDGLRLLQLSQEMDLAEAELERVQQPVVEIEVDRDERRAAIYAAVKRLREAYAGLATAFGRIIAGTEVKRRNPFWRAKPIEFHLTLAFLLDNGNEIRTGPDRMDPRESPPRYDAAHQLMTYVSRFGQIPGLMAPTGLAPANWPHFALGMAMIRREEAERSLQMRDAIGSLFGDESQQTRWLEATQRAAGRSLSHGPESAES